MAQGKEESIPNEERTLSALIEGAAMAVPQIDGESYQAFLGKARTLALQVRDTAPVLDRMAVIEQVVREFERYRVQTENAVRARVTCWRALTGEMLRELIRRMGLEPSSPGVGPLVSKLGFLGTAEDLAAYRQMLNDFLHPPESPELDIATTLKLTDHSTTNDNATGLRGGGGAIEYLRGHMERSKRGFVVHFKLGCLEVISQRFGMEAVEDALMAVSNYLTESMHAEDKTFHWSDSSLMAIVHNRANRQILEAEVARIVALNKNITIQIGGRTVMLRIPMEYEIMPISAFRAAEDLEKFFPGPQIEGEGEENG